MSKAQYRALSKLKRNMDILIKPADKGRNVAIMDREDYIKEGNRQLENTEFYQETTSNLTPDHTAKVRSLAQKLLDEGQISKQTYIVKYLVTNCDHTSQFYMLPKIHKDPQHPPGRPIVSSISSPTEHLSHLVDTILNPLVPRIKSFVKDTTDFINQVERVPIRPDTILVTLDVSSLYTNIPHGEGLRAVAEFLAIHRSPMELPSNANIIRMSDLVLTCNNFEFNGRYFLQTSGTAMGTRVAPSYANIFMDWFERKYVYTYADQPDFWVRFIDDIKTLWSLGADKLERFIVHLNSSHPTIRFTVIRSQKMVPFLDTEVFLLPDHKLGITIHSKETDSHDYLLYSSDHPKHVKDSIPYSQFLRIRRICTEWLDFMYQAIIILGHFVRRGYPSDLLLGSLGKACERNRQELLHPTVIGSSTTPQNKTKTKEVFCVFTHNRTNLPIQELVAKHWPMLGRSAATRPLLDYKITYSRRRPPNLKDWLCRAKLPVLDRQSSRPSCKSPGRCTYCPDINTTGTFTHPVNKKTHVVMKNVCCQSTNLIYLLQCTVCNSLYVGQTKNAIMKRTYQHKYSIRRNDVNSTVARHYNAHDPVNPDQMKIHVLEFIKLPPESFAAWQLRLQREKVWISRLDTLIPTGLNLLE